MQHLSDFLTPVPMAIISDDKLYYEGQIGKHINVFDGEMPDLSDVDIVIIGVTENRGAGTPQSTTNAANTVRKHLYDLHYWHTDVKIADIGNVKTGASLKDSYAAITSELQGLLEQGKKVLIIGGSHDITLAQYNAYKNMQTAIDATCIDAKIDLSNNNPVPAESFLMELFTAEPNYLKHYNHLAFQSYYVHPHMLETIDKLRFDCFRVGMVQEQIDDMEPILRSTNMLSMDVNCIKFSDAPSNKTNPNGLTGIEACMLARFAGMSKALSSFGIYGYLPESDVDELTARQISQMIWYFIDGINRNKVEAPIEFREAYNEFHTRFGEIETAFLQNKRTLRWWMEMPENNFVPCTYDDYLKARNGDIPERWLRVQERGI